MLGSIRIGTVFGIHLRMHWLFVLMAAIVLLLPGSDPLALSIQFGVLFSIVILHELGHCLVARRFGIRVLDITIWPLGGMARMSEIPEDTKVEALIALAGPAVNFALAFLSVPVWIWSNVQESPTLVVQTLGSAFGYFVLFNLVLGVFNLIPAFPMDGGRVLRALLGSNGDWVGATQTAVRVGKLFAALMVLIGILFMDTDPGLAVLPLIGVFVWFAGSRELRAVRMRHAPAFRSPFGGAFSPFAPPAAPPSAPPRAAASESVRAEPARTSDPSGARRPSGIPASGHRLSDADIERLERFRGPLRGFENE